jgi:hypothetical protein
LSTQCKVSQTGRESKDNLAHIFFKKKYQSLKHVTGIYFRFQFLSIVTAMHHNSTHAGGRAA